jgi:hypothetical protein
VPALSGTWRDTAQAYAKPTPLHVADPRHALIGHEPSPGEYAHEAPAYPYAMPRGREDFGSQEVPDIRGLQLDITPATHEEGSVGWLFYTQVSDLDKPGAPDDDLLRKTHAAHARDQGGSKKQNYSERTFKFFDERYLFFRIPGLGVEATDAIPPESGGGGRGLTGQSVNNPPLESYLGRGFWPGTTEQATVSRRFQARVIQRNDERAQTPNLPYFEANAPAPRPGNQSVTPFSALQRMMSGVYKIALQRRTPPVPGDIQAERVLEDTDSPPVGADFYG